MSFKESMKENLKKFNYRQGIVAGGLVVVTVALILAICSLGKKPVATSKSNALRQEYIDIAVAGGKSSMKFLDYETTDQLKLSYGENSISTSKDYLFDESKEEWGYYLSVTNSDLTEKVEFSKDGSTLELSLEVENVYEIEHYQYSSTESKMVKVVDKTSEIVKSTYFKENGKYYVATKRDFTSTTASEDHYNSYYEFTDEEAYKIALASFVGGTIYRTFKDAYSSRAFGSYGYPATFEKNGNKFSVDLSLDQINHSEIQEEFRIDSQTYHWEFTDGLYTSGSSTISNTGWSQDSVTVRNVAVSYSCGHISHMDLSTMTQDPSLVDPMYFYLVATIEVTA